MVSRSQQQYVWVSLGCLLQQTSSALTPPDLLITCAHLPASEIQRGLINIQLLPSPMEHKKSFDLHVSDGGSRTWLLPAENCTTWLVSKFVQSQSIKENPY